LEDRIEEDMNDAEKANLIIKILKEQAGGEDIIQRYGKA
jgi:hypothetical protein